MRALLFDYPWALLGFAIFIPLVLYDFFSLRRKQIEKILPRYLQKKLLLSRIGFRVFLACIITALAGPRWGVGPTADEYRLQGRRAVDAVIALDVSHSMNIIDSHTTMTRMEQGLSIVKEAVSAMPGARFAVAISRDRGIVAVPLTWDQDAVLAFLDAADSSLAGRGTNLESLVDAAASAFRSSNFSTRMIFLVSDGEALSGSLKAAVGRCKRDGITVISIAVGSDTGAPLSGESLTGSVTSEIISSRDSGAMRMAAGQTGGIYIDGNLEDASRILAGHLRSLAPGTEIRGAEKEPRARWFIFVMLAILSLGASKLSLLKLGNRE